MKNLLRIVLFSLIVLLISCTSKPFDCDDWAENFKDESETDIVLNSIERNGSLMYLHGINSRTGNKEVFYEGSGWISKIYRQFAIGDTIIKKKGAYTIIIKRRNKIFTIPMRCQGKVYEDK